MVKSFAQVVCQALCRAMTVEVLLGLCRVRVHSLIINPQDPLANIQSVGFVNFCLFFYCSRVETIHVVVHISAKDEHRIMTMVTFIINICIINIIGDARAMISAWRVGGLKAFMSCDLAHTLLT